LCVCVCVCVCGFTVGCVAATLNKCVCVCVFLFAPAAVSHLYVILLQNDCVRKVAPAKNSALKTKHNSAHTSVQAKQYVVNSSTKSVRKTLS
jgi:archaellum component FlaF (FlaF/FlaG flagellin family)